MRTIEGGQLAFWCPGCEEAHGIAVRGQTGAGDKGWIWDGNVDSPTFSPSILIRSGHYAGHFKPGVDECWCTYDAAEVAAGREPSGFGCSICHSFVRGGRIEFCSDSTHKLSGQTVPLPDFP